MTTITRERVAEIIYAAGLEPCDYEEVFASIKTGEIVAMARIALASLEAEPIGITDRSEIECLKRGEMANVMPPDYKGVDAGDEVFIYTAPPAPVSVPDEHNSVIAEQLAHVLSGMDVTDHQRAIINCAVDRLNKNAEVIQQKLAYSEMPEVLDYQGAKELFNYLMTEEETNATVNGWNACRAAMLQGEKS